MVKSIMKSSTITRVVFLGAAAIIGIIALQTYWVLSTWNINEEEFNQKAHLALYNVARSLSELSGTALPTRNVIRQRTSNYYVVNIADEIDTHNLEYFLQRELEALALHIDFEYAVFDCHTDEMVYGNYCSYTPERKKDIAYSQFPKYSEFTYYFGVKFPTRSGYLFSKMQLSIVLSLILLVTVVFFAYSMFVILRQKQLSEMQKDFINNMTHEFKTPISSIKISTDMFLRHPLIQSDARLRQYASIISEQNLRLNNQVESVLQLALIERGNVALNLEPVALHELLEEAVASVRMPVEEQGGQIRTEFAPEPLVIHADRLHLSNIVHSLLDNAIKYCREAPDITLRTTREPHQICLTISDRGIGIPPAHQARIFEKFYRVPTGNVHNVKGFGLGLFYVRSICRKHGWRLRLDSAEGQGTDVQVCMPT